MKTYYIQSGNSNTKIGVPELLRGLANKADEIGRVRPIYLYLSQGVDDGTYATIESEVYKLRNIDQVLQADASKLYYRDTQKQAHQETNKNLRRQTVYLLEFDSGDTPEIDFSSFLRYVADEIDNINKIIIYDIIYHEKINEFGLVISIIRVYCNMAKPSM